MQLGVQAPELLQTCIYSPYYYYYYYYVDDYDDAFINLHILRFIFVLILI